MSSVTNGKTLLECAAQLEGKLHYDVPVSVKDADLYIVFGEKAFSNTLLLEASEEGSSINKVLGIGIDKEETLWLQLHHADEWRKAVCLEEVASRDPNEWLGYCAEKGGLNHILWCLAYDRDVVSQYHWPHDMLDFYSEDLNSKLLERTTFKSINPSNSSEGIGYSRDSDPWKSLNRRQNFWPGFSRNFGGYPLSRRGKQPRGKSLTDKRNGNLSRRYIKDFS